MKSVLITGVSGFIGRHLAARLAGGDIGVVGTSRTGTPIAGARRVHRIALTESLQPILESEPVDAVVHCANDSSPDQFHVNLDGTTAWLEEAHRAGVNLQIFLSSLSAGPDAASSYGRAKHEIETRVREIGGVVFRLGVVVGNGGMFLKMRSSLQRFPLVPLLDNGRAPIHVIGVDTLCCILRDSLGSKTADLRGGAWNLQQPRAYPLRDVLRSVRRQYGDSCWLVPVPSLPVYWLLALLERLPLLHPPVSTTNLLGYRQHRNRAPRSDFERFGYPEEDLAALVRKAADCAGQAAAKREGP